MEKFNKGDKVRILDVDKIGGADAYFKNGDTTHVISVACGGYPYIYCNDGDYVDGLFITDRELNYLELISETPTPKYRTEKRKANVGERILITNANTSMGYYDNGDVLTVASHYNGLSNGIKVKETKGDCPFIRHEEYEVIVEVKPSYPERISLLESQVAELQAKVEALEKVKYVFGVDLAKPTPNEQRKAAIKRAKAFIEEAKVDLSISRGKGYVLGEIGRICDVQFIVNNDKRTVVALFRWRHDGNVYVKAIAKCAPDDVFNADIGKAIALGRALGLDVSEFENAVKPTEYVNGHIVTFPETDSWHRRVQYRIDDVSSADNNMTITSDEIAIKGKTGVGRTASSDLTRGYLPIIDDTEAQY